MIENYSEEPYWGIPSPNTAATLDLVSDTADASTAFEWRLFCNALDQAARNGTVSQNDVRPLIAGKIAAPRVGSFYHRAIRAGILIVRAGFWEPSTDTKGGNRGKPCRVYGYNAKSPEDAA